MRGDFRFDDLINLLNKTNSEIIMLINIVHA